MIFNRFFLTSAAILGFLAVLIGAFGAHALPRMLDVQTYAVNLKPFHTGAEYQFYHVFALVLVAFLPKNRLSTLAGWCFLVGIFLFSFSLYLMVITGIKALGMITPVGGLLLMSGWGCMALYGWRSTDQP